MRSFLTTQGPAFWPALAGGMLLGVAVVLLLALNGRVAGISGIFGRLLGGQRVAANAAFLIGLLLGPLLYTLVPVYTLIHAAPPTVTVTAHPALLIVAGLLVGVGTRMGSGCTSGHGILGLARLSKRSLVATGVFLAVGVAVATIIGTLHSGTLHWGALHWGALHWGALR